MNKIMDAALDLVWATEIGKQVTDLKDNVMDTVGLKAETKEALQEANLDQVATAYESLVNKVGISDQKETITKFISKGDNKDEFRVLHAKIKSLAQQWGADISKLDEVLTTHELTGWFDWVGTYGVVNFFGKLFSPFKKVLEKLNLVHSAKDLGKMVFAINEATNKIDVSKLNNEWEDNLNEEFNEWDHVKIDGKELLGTDVSKEAKHFVDYAETYEDEEYVWWGNGKKWVDCSWLITQCLKKWWINIQRTAATQIKDTRLNDRSIENAQLWDLIFFENKWKNHNRQITHVWIIKGRLENGDVVIYDASRNKEQVSTRVIKPVSDKFEYHIKDTSQLLKDLEIKNMAYNNHTGESVDWMIQAA